MKYEKFIIENYRAIEHIELRLDSSLIPIIGLNESGKTTIFNALLAFDNHNDERFPEAINSVNTYAQQADGSVTAFLQLNDEEAQHISRLDPTVLKNWYRTWSRADLTPQQKGYIKLTRSLTTQDYSLALKLYNIEEINYPSATSEPANQIIKYILNRLPSMIYFADFIDRVPKTIKYEAIANTNLSNIPTEANEWTSILDKLFEKAGYDIEAFLEKSEHELDQDYEGFQTHEEIIVNVEKHLNQAIAHEWMRLVDSETTSRIPYQIKLIYSRSRDFDQAKNFQKIEHTFKIRLYDYFDQSRPEPSPFELNDRSKGFLWFANFVLKVRFSPEFKRAQSGTIFLLDEPGAYLHSSAQEELLDVLVNISESSTILYATHLPQLLDPTKIRIFDCRVSYRDDWKIKLDKYGELPSQENVGPLTTLYEALQLKLTGFIHPHSSDPFVITEGITDFYAFLMVKEHTSIFDNLKFYLIPGSGVTKLQNLISLAIAWSPVYAVIFDKDTEANKAIARYKNDFDEEHAQRYWIQLENVKGDKNVAVERLFSDDDKKRIEDLTGVEIKKAIPILFFSDATVKESYWAGIDPETEQNFEKLRDMLDAILNPTP